MKRMLLALAALGFAGGVTAQTIHFSPVNLDATPAKPGAPWTATLRYPAGASDSYTMAFDLQRAATPAVLPGIGEFGLAFSPVFFFIKSGTLDAQGEDTLTLNLPNDANLVGLRFYLQAIVATQNVPSGAILSNLFVGDINAGGSHKQVDGTLNLPRALHSLTELPDGRVLVIGGGGGSIATPVGTQVSEVYYPWTQSFDFTRTAGGAVTQTNVQRVSHTATLLDDGRVLLVGGIDVQGNPLASAEVFNPATGQFTLVGSLSQARGTHTATKLPNGNVLIAGGTTAAFQFPGLFGGASRSTEIFNPTTNTFSAGPNMLQRRMFHSAVAVRTGGRDYVAMFSGINGLFLVFPTYTATAEVYDVTGNTFSSSIGGSSIGNMAQARVAMGTTVLPNGNVLLAGGAAGTVPGATNRTEEFNPSTGGFSSGQNMGDARVLPGVNVAGGAALIEGGVQGSLTAPSATDKCELYSNGSNTATSNLTVARGAQVSILLRSGAVLSVGGADAGANPLGSAEVYTP